MGSKTLSPNRKAVKAGSELTEVHSLAEVPDFASDEEFAEFWDTHAPTEEFLKEAELPLPEWAPLPPRSANPLSVRFDRDTLTRLKALARKKHIGYQTLLKQFVIERLYEEERREGILPARRRTTRT